MGKSVVVAGYVGAAVEHLVAGEEEVTFVGDLGETSAGAVDVLRVFVIGLAPTVDDVHVGREVCCGLNVQDEVELLHDCFLVVVLLWGGDRG